MTGIKVDKQPLRPFYCPLCKVMHDNPQRHCDTTEHRTLAAAELQKNCDLATQFPRPVKKTEDKQVAPVILRPAYCSLCKVQYYNAKMQCDTVLHHALAAQ